jgi:glucosamine--fructose-6-phosphate aminotransferase (isomerizing)
MIEELTGVPCEAELASELRYRPNFADCQNLAIVTISQSGETADTLAVLRELKKKGALALGIVNVVGSTIARETDAGVYNHIGPEIGVASTKAFTSQLAILALFSLFLGRERGKISEYAGKKIAEELSKIPNLVRYILKQDKVIKQIAKKYKEYNNFLYIGRRYNFPIAYEGALKLKEVSYVHAEGYGAGEMKHGPIAMIDENFPTVAIAPLDSVYEKMISNMEEIKARKGKIIAITTEGDEKIKSIPGSETLTRRSSPRHKGHERLNAESGQSSTSWHIAEDWLYMPKTLEMLTPMLSVIPLQLFAYYMGVLRGYDVDKPKNLAKSVTVE